MFGLMNAWSPTPELSVDVGVLGILLDKLSTWWYLIAHKHREYAISFGSIIDGNLA